MAEVLTTDPAAASFVDRRRPPLRLRLHHLFALTAVMSVMLAVSKPQYNFGDYEASQLLQAITVLWGIVYTILASVAITAVAYGIVWRRQGYVFFNEPGHWLLVEVAARQLLYFIPAIALQTLVGMEGRPLDIVTALVLMVMQTVIVLGFNVYIAIKKCVERHWSWVFYAKAASGIVPVLGDLLVLLFLERAVKAENPRRRWLQRWTAQRGYVAPVVADHRKRRTRDAAHWCGVVVQFALAGLTVAMMGMVFVGTYLAIFSR